MKYTELSKIELIELIDMLVSRDKEISKLQQFKDEAFEVYPNIDLAIAILKGEIE